MRCQCGWKVIAGLLLLWVLMGGAVRGNAATQEAQDERGRVSDDVAPMAVEEAFFASFDSEPAGLTSNFFSLTLGGETFDFIFTDEGDDWGADGFEHELSWGEGGGASMNLVSGANELLTTERVVIGRQDGADFVFQSIFVNNRDGRPVTVAGFNNGGQVGAAQTAGNGSAVTLNFSGLVVDEVRLTSPHFENTYIDSFAGDTSTAMDYGDLPGSYGMTSDADNGARHALGAVYLGSCVDADADGQASAMADGDDTDGTGETIGVCAIDHGDEEGVAPGSRWQDGAGGGSIQVLVAGGDGCLSGWIDWDSDSSFSEVADQVLDMEPVSSRPNAMTFDVPTGVFSGSDPQPSFFARFRLSADLGESGNCADDSVLQLDGSGGAGEVEDYYWSFSPTAVEVSRIAATEIPVSGIKWLALVVLLLSIAMSTVVIGKVVLTVTGNNYVAHHCEVATEQHG